MPLFTKKSFGILRFWLLLVTALSAAGAADVLTMSRPAVAQSATIREISVVGNRRVEPETVRSYLQFQVGDAYDAGKVDRSLKALFATGLFADVRIDRQGSGVVVTVAENPVVNQIAFEGNSEVEKATLESEVQLKPRSVFTRARVQADVQRILDVYRRQGRFAAKVEPKLIELEQNRVNVVFEITEGNATKVKGINFVGNRAFSDSQLRDIISTTQAGWFDFLKGTAFYDPDRLNLDRELVRQYYLKNGYADVRVTSATAELDADGSGFFLTIVVEEGQLYRFGDVRVESTLPGINPDALKKELLTSPGDIYNGALIDKSVEKLTLSISEQGYAFGRVRPRSEPDRASRTITLVYAVDEGPRVYIERINVIGNTRTKDHVIRREFRLAEGDAYNPLMVDRAKKRLESLGFFKGVAVKKRPGTSNDRVVLDVEVVEQSTGELSFGAGYSTMEGVIGDVSISERNLLGNGQFLRLRLAGSMERLQADLSFTEPRFLDQNLSAGFDIFHKDVDQTATSSFKYRKTGFSPRLGFPISESLWAQVSYMYSHDSVYSVDATRASRAIQEAMGTTDTSSIGMALTYDARNHPRNPNRGIYFQGGVDFAGLGGDVQYVRYSAEGRAYYPITDKITFVGRAIAGYIEGWGGQDVRLLDLFFRGGETVRGFARSGYGPRDLVTGDALGGTTFWATTVEIRFPLPFIPDELGMSGAVFADAGSLFGAGARAKQLNDGNSLILADDSSIRASVGASLMWNSPVGPIRLDLAQALMKETYDKDQFFRFGASTKF